MKKRIVSLLTVVLCSFCYGTTSHALSPGAEASIERGAPSVPAGFSLHCGMFYDSLTGAIDTSVEADDVSVTIGEHDLFLLMGSSSHSVADRPMEMLLVAEFEQGGQMVRHYTVNSRYMVDVRFEDGIVQSAEVQSLREVAHCK